MADQERNLSTNSRLKNKVCSGQSDPLAFLSRVNRRKRSQPLLNSGIKFNVSSNNQIIQSLKKQDFYENDEVIVAEALLTLSRETYHKKRKPKIKDNEIGNFTIPIKSDNNHSLPSMDEGDDKNPTFSSRRKTEQNPINNPDIWEIKKVLYKSDVDKKSRLMLSTRLVEEKIFTSVKPAMAENCSTSTGQKFMVYDVDDEVTHILTLKKHTGSSNSFVFNGEWASGFANRKNLKAGDEVGMSWDDSNCRFLFKLLKRAHKIDQD